MSNGEPEIDFGKLDRTYRKTWEEFCIEVTVLHSLVSDARSEAVVAGAKNRVADAERSYRESRDTLAQHLMSSIARLAGVSQRHEEEMPWTCRLERLAYRLWEDRGRYHGNADADWYRAEDLLRA